MNHRRIFLLLVALGLGSPAFAAKNTPVRKAPESDLAPIESRRASVNTAQALAKVDNPGPLPEALPLPFNPSGFNRVVREEPKPSAETPGQATAPKASGDREVLAAIAQRVTPNGTFNLGGSRFLQFSKKRLKVGDHLTVTHEGQDYNLELTAIDATNFTLRLNREEITRPIKPGK